MRSSNIKDLIIPYEKAKLMSFYSHGITFDYFTSYQIVQEAFINQIVIDEMTADTMKNKRMLLLLKLIVNEANDRSLIIMDIHQLFIKQVIKSIITITNNDKNIIFITNKNNQININQINQMKIVQNVNDMMDKIQHIDTPESYLKDILFLYKLLVYNNMNQNILINKNDTKNIMKQLNTIQIRRQSDDKLMEDYDTIQLYKSVFYL